jgi:hypothetical protein
MTLINFSWLSLTLGDLHSRTEPNVDLSFLDRMAAEPLPRVRLSIGLELISTNIYGEVNNCEQNYRGSIPGGGRIFSVKRILMWIAASRITGVRFRVEAEFIL